MNNNQEQKQTLTSKFHDELEKINSNPYTQIAQNIHNIKQLLYKGADINSKDSNGDTLLHIIVSSKELKTYNAYIAHNLQVNPSEKTKYLLDLSTVLSDNLPNPFIKNKDGMTALDIAIKKQLKNEIKTLTAYENAYVSFFNEKQTYINQTESSLKFITSHTFINKKQHGRENN